MRRYAVLIPAALLAAPHPLPAQPMPVPKDGKVTIPLDLSPAAAPKPASKFYLYPEYRDQQPGDKLSGFLKCFAEQDTFFNKENTDKRQKWRDMPLAELPADVRELAGIKNGMAYDPPHASLMVFMDQAARYNRVEWNEWFNLRKDGVYLLLPELQKLRSLAFVVHLRLRGEIKNREFDRAIVSVKTLLGLADFCRTHPTLIGNLVGLAIANSAAAGLEEMIQQPGCPDLFWSLTDLPTPLVPMRKGLEGERMFLAAQFSYILEADRPMTDAEMDRHLKQLETIIAVNDTPKPKADGPKGKLEAAVTDFLQNPRLRYTGWSQDEDRVGAARKRLVEFGGFKPETVQTFPPLQVVMIDDMVQYEVMRDELTKYYNLPFPQSKGSNEVEAKLKQQRGSLFLAPLLVAAVDKVKQAEVRMDQWVAFLRVAEAARLFAHENGGNLPGSLAEIKLPLPNDPVSGKPFDYAVKDGAATLSGTNAIPLWDKTNPQFEPRSGETNQQYEQRRAQYEKRRAETNRVYELRIRK